MYSALGSPLWRAGEAWSSLPLLKAYTPLLASTAETKGYVNVSAQAFAAQLSSLTHG